MLQDTVAKATFRDLREEDKHSRFAKTHKEVVRPWLLGAQWRIMGYQERRNSQGGYLVVSVSEEAFADCATN